ncbi:MAG: FG-GAP repeat domain-containing protein [Verrucomicrobiia bacterium]|tara:strand:- start:5975 stop:7282 length:1308 start_codon:yes stop_codon:yes gene_type:complete
MPQRSLKPYLVLAAGAVVGVVAGIGIIRMNAVKVVPHSDQAETSPAREPLIKFSPEAIGTSVEEFGRPEVTHVQIVDLDQDGLPDVLYCESSTNTVRWVRQTSRNVFEESIVATDVAGPVHVAAADVYGNGRLDLLIASMGQVLPNSDSIGRVFVFEAMADGSFKRHLLLDRVARVTDVRAANLTDHSDGRLDLIVGQFGYDEGETRLLVNQGDWKFSSQALNGQSGCIHTPIGDFDGDGRLDIAALISQEWEEVHLFRNLGAGKFSDEILWGSTNEDFGSSGMKQVDLNQDGKLDLIFSNGDGFDYSIRGPRAWHGIQWLENIGEGKFDYHRIGEMPGAYAPSAADLDSDGDLDLIAVSGFGDWSNPDTVTLMAWINDGEENFEPEVIATQPIQMVTADAGDLDGDGIPEIVTGGYHSFPPFEHMSAITLWRRQ